MRLWRARAWQRQCDVCGFVWTVSPGERRMGHRSEVRGGGAGAYRWWVVSWRDPRAVESNEAWLALAPCPACGKPWGFTESPLREAPPQPV